MSRNEPAAQTRHKIIAYWLLAICGMVFAMVILGGVTRLTHSGLSMVEWKPVTGWLPPLTEAEWLRVFAKYKEFPEYQKVNAGMTVDEFKSIFWLEFIHRLWGRLMGVAFLAPFIFFVAKGWVNRALFLKLCLMFVLGGLQGALGWYMVKSGLSDRPDVSQYRLTAHLGAALAVYAYMFWVALGLLWPKPLTAASGGRKQDACFPSPHLIKIAMALPALIFITALSGGFVAGLDAGFAFNTFPLMDGGLVPKGFLDMTPVYLNFFENIAAVQFNHRLLAETVFILAIGFWILARKLDLAPGARRAVNLLALMAVIQVSLGILTLLLAVPASLAAAHQGGAVILLTMSLWAVHELQS